MLSIFSFAVDAMMPILSFSQRYFTFRFRCHFAAATFSLLIFRHFDRPLRLIALIFSPLLIFLSFFFHYSISVDYFIFSLLIRFQLAMPYCAAIRHMPPLRHADIAPLR
jgi:hypothetical protein